MSEPETAPRLMSDEEYRHIRHELRTPVNHIIGYSDMLIEEFGDQQQHALVHGAQDIHATGRELLQRISVVLDTGDTNPVQLSQLMQHPELDESLLHIIEQSRALAAQAAAADATEFLSDIEKITVAAQHLQLLLKRGAQGVIDDVAEQPHSPTSPTITPTSAQHSGHLLVVDDNEGNLDMLMRRLTRLGYQAIPARSGREALDLLHTEAVDLILLDIMMPDMNGYEVLEHLKSHDTHRHIPVVVLSALDEIESVVHCINLGAEDYLPKPFDPVLLQARISALLEKKFLRDQEVSYLEEIERERQRVSALLNVVVPIGVALSAEKNYDRLLQTIVLEAMGLCNADGGTLYLRTDDDLLKFVIVRNRSLGIALGGVDGEPCLFPPLRLYDETTKQPNHRFVVTHATLTSSTVVIRDAYDADGFDFSGTRSFDQGTGYRSRSIVVVPLRDSINRVIGIIQLLNAQDRNTGDVIEFDSGMIQTVESLSSLAAAALAVYDREQRLRQQIADLRIEIDTAKSQKAVDEITGTEYFQNLSNRARELRHGSTEQLRPTAVTTEALSETHRIYEVNGIPIHVHEEGSDNHQIAILIHGWSSSWFALSPLLPQIARKYRCLCVDLPGYGESPPMAEEATITKYADLLADMIRQQTSQQVVLIGHSMGGMISMMIAIRHPELVERMILLCPTVSGNLSTFINVFIGPITFLEQFTLANRLVAAIEPQVLNITDRLMRPASFAERTGIQEQTYHRLRADARRPGQGRVRSECFWAMRQNNLSGQLKHIKAPSLVIWGMEDNTVPLRDASIIADEWPDADLKIFPKAGHWPQFETPDQTLRAIRGFLGQPIKLLRTQF